MKPLQRKLVSISILSILAFSVSVSLAVAATDPIKSPQPPTNQRNIHQTDLFTGSVKYSYPITLPKGTNDLTPELSLSYDSSGSRDVEQRNGAGWQINQDYVERDVNYTPADISDDKYKLNFKGATYELVYVASESTYHTKIESYLKIKKISTGGSNTKGDYWQVTTPDGTKYRLGYETSSETVCSHRDYVTRWNLDLVTDIHGNNIYYYYISQSNNARLNGIQWNNDKSRYVEFQYGESPYKRPAYHQGCYLDETQRLNKVIVKANDVPVHQYKLNYGSASNGQQLLRSITEQGSATTSALPATMFTNNPEVKSWQTQYVRWLTDAALDGAYLQEQHTKLLDVNGDSLPDIVRSTQNGTSNTYSVYLNIGTTWNTQAQVWVNNAPIDAHLSQQNVRLTDVTGDALPDIVKTTYSGTNVTWYVYKNTGSAWATQAETWINNAAIDARLEQTHVTLSDVNGDGLADIVKAYANGTNDVWMVYRNTGTNWNIQGETWLDAAITARLDQANVRLTDVTGDGLPDIVKSTNNGTLASFYVYKNNGSSWNPFSQTYIDNADIDTHLARTDTTLADVNGDGLTDIVTSKDGTTSCRYSWKVLLNQGDKWSTTFDTWMDDADTCAALQRANVTLSDTNGDSLLDIVRTSDGVPASTGKSNWDVFLNNGSAPNLLSQIKTPQGGTMNFEYTPSTKFSNKGSDNLPDLPYTLWLVTKTIVNNGMTNSHGTSDVTTYNYKNGYHKWQAREFRGFAEVNQTDPNGTKKQFFFKQDDALQGMLSQTLTTDTQNNLYTKTDNTWSSTAANGVTTVNLTQEKNYLYDGVATNPLETQSDYFYDNFGNVIKTLDYGNKNLSGDEKHIHSEYTYNTSDWIINTIKHSYVNDAADVTKVSESWFYYDNHLLAGDAPSKGSLTKETKWLDGGSNPTKTYTYDTFGNVLSETDANNRTTTYTYDVIGTYLASVTNAKNQTTLASYDLGTGNLISNTDPNNQTTTYQYDTFGRVVKEIKPYDSAQYPTIQYQYFIDGAAPEGVSTSLREVSGASATIDTYMYTDGFGRIMQSRQDAEDITKQIVKDTFYNAMGEVLKATVPYLANSTMVASPSSQTFPQETKFGDGSDGNLTISANTTDAPIDSPVTASANATTATVGQGFGFVPNQIILFHQTQGTNAGKWEYARVESYSGTTLTITEALSNAYSSSSNNRAQVRVVPQYDNVTVNSGVVWKAKSWNGSTGGILAFLASGVVTINGTVTSAGGNGTVNTGNGNSTGGTGGGFRGGVGYKASNNSHTYGQAGESYISYQPQPSGEAIPNMQQVNRGNGGVGSTFNTGTLARSGGGGGNSTEGTIGTNGLGGLASGNASLLLNIFGGGGGGGSRGYERSGGSGGGGAGGGIIAFLGSTITVSSTGVLNVNGGNGGLDPSTNGQASEGGGASGGGGAGGNIHLRGQVMNVGTNRLLASGGAGGNAVATHNGNGGVGRIRVEYESSMTGSTTPVASTAQVQIPLISAGVVVPLPSPGNYATPDVNAKFTEYTYDPIGRVNIIKNPKGDSKTIAYDHGKITTIDENSHIKRRQLNAFNKITAVEEVIDGTTYTTSYTYNTRDELTKITDAPGNESTFVYNTLGQKTSQTDPDMGTWTYTYDAVGNLTSQKDARNITTTHTYDQLHRVTKVDYLNTTDTLYTYDTGKIGVVSSITDTAGTVNYTYDNRLRKTEEQRTINGITKTTAFSYDTADRMVTQTNPDGEVVTYAFNDQGEINSVTGATSIVNNIDYNALGKITKKQFANGLATNYTYNTNDFRLNKVQTGTVQDLNYAYDSVGNVSSITDSINSKTQSFTYDSLDRLKTASESAGFNHAYSYNAIGNLTAFNDNGNITNYAYGQGAGVHALTSSSNIYTIYDEGLGSGWNDWSWNATNNVSDTSNPNTGTTNISWTATAGYGGLYLHKTGGVNTTGYGTLTFALKASQAGQNAKVSLYDGNDTVIGTGVSLANYGGNPVVGSYKIYTIPLADLGGANKVINGVLIQDQTGSAQPAMFVDSIRLQPGAQTSTTYIYNDSLASGWNDWSWSSTNDINSTTAPHSGSKHISWTANAGYAGLYLQKTGGIDTTGQTALTFALQASQSGQTVQVQLYDNADTPIGSPVQLTSYGGDPVAGSYKVYTIPLADLGGSNRQINGVLIQDISGTAKPAMYVDAIGLVTTVQTASNKTYSYDANGNMTTDGTTCYQYNDANRLYRVSKCSTDHTVAEYVYDYNGNRMVKKNYVNNVYTNFVISWSDSYESKTIVGGVTENTTYYFANSQLIAKKNPDGSKYYFHNDHLGSTSIITNQTGGVVEETKYDPWGVVLSGGTKSKFLYTGQERDDETKLHYYNARYYDPGIRRFTQPDSLIQDIYNPQDLNRYSYVRNNPLKYTDPTGHFSIKGIISSIKRAVGAVVNRITPKSAPAPKPASVAKLPTKYNFQNVKVNLPSQNKPTNSGIFPVASATNTNSNASSKSQNNQPILNPNIDVSKINILTIANNQRAAAEHPVSLTPAGVNNATWFYDTVRSQGAMDYKNNPGYGSNYQQFGNVNFGSVARESGFNKYFTENGAGLYQVLKHGIDDTVHGIPLIQKPWGDDIPDNTDLVNGYDKIGTWR